MSHDLYIYLVIICSTLVTYGIRVAGFWGSRMIDQHHPAFIFMNYINYAIVGALVVQLIITPQNILAAVPIWARIALSLACVLAYVLHRRYLFLYIILTVAVLSILNSLWLTPPA